jgi:hypothetical protein
MKAIRKKEKKKNITKSIEVRKEWQDQTKAAGLSLIKRACTSSQARENRRSVASCGSVSSLIWKTFLFEDDRIYQP